MLKRIIIADASCLIALQNIEQLDLLQKVYSEIIITPEVKIEFGEDLPKWIKIEKVIDKNKIKILELELDKGEASAIALALENEKSLLIIDEKRGRKVAKRIGIAIVGILGVILKAKEFKIIETVKPLLENLESVGFRISKQLKIQILVKVGEI